jgi:hypothetical protein
MIYASRLRFYEPFFQCDLLCLFFVWFFSQPDVNITDSPITIHGNKKTNKNIGGRKIHEYGKPKAPTKLFSITPLFNLLALHNKLNPKSVCLFVCCHEVFLYSISKIVFPHFGNRLHITGTKINRQILNTNATP